MAIQQVADRISLHPKTLFLMDGLGAIISAFMLGVVLVEFENIFGIPRPTLYFLALLPCAFAAYDFYCFIKLKEDFGLFLKVIASINIAYSCLSLGLAFYHSKVVSNLGWTYVVFEIIIVIILAKLEFKTANRISGS